MRWSLLVAPLLLLVGHADGARGAARVDALRPVVADDVVVDWRVGAIRATAIGLADRHAPSPASARATSRRRAEDAAWHRLRAALPAVPRVSTPALDDARLDALQADTIVTAAELRPDGGWRVELTLPLESLRLALVGPRAVDRDSDDRTAPTAIVVDARKLAATPRVGLGLGASTGWQGPVVWVDAEPPAALVGARPVTVMARALDDTQLTLEEAPPGAAAALVVVRLRGGTP